MPTLEGVVNVLRELAGKPILWINLREEAIAYINGKPYVALFSLRLHLCLFSFSLFVSFASWSLFFSLRCRPFLPFLPSVKELQLKERTERRYVLRNAATPFRNIES